MVRLARHYGVSRVAQVLRVNYTGLKRHLVASSAPQAPRTDALDAEFVEVPITACPGGPPWVIELEDGEGSKLTLRLARADRAAALALAQGLWRQRS
jgi:hypothetical protein